MADTAARRPPDGQALAGGAPVLGGASHVLLRPLSITPSDDDSFMVGDLARGEFIQVPPIAVTVINALRPGQTVADAAAEARREAGQEVDVVEFVETLIDCGFVAAVDGVPLQSQGPELTDGGQLGATLARLARPFYSAPAWAVYGVLFCCCLVLLTAVPWFRPHYDQLFFLPNPVLSIVLLTVITVPTAMLHELAHWLGARLEGVPARITIGRRYYIVVFQTDLSALWAVPRRRRFGPLLAGMALDVVVIAALLGLRASQFLGWWHPEPVLARLFAALVVALVVSVSLQFVVFLRTDIYAVLITGLGCVNLTRISRLRMARIYRRLTATEEREFANASPRDRDMSRWYCWVQLGGALIVAWNFVVFFVPSLVHTLRWIGDGLTRNSAATAEFWYVAGSSIVAFLLVAIPPFTYARDRARRARRPQRGT
jgi:putative peptide zinc metalloprotease protein